MIYNSYDIIFRAEISPHQKLNLHEFHSRVYSMISKAEVYALYGNFLRLFMDTYHWIL